MAQIAEPIQKGDAKRPLPIGWMFFIAGVVLLLWLSQQLPLLDQFSDSWYLGLRETLNDFKEWVVENRRTHWIFVFFFEPLSDSIDFGLRRIEDFLLFLPWPITLLAFFLLGERFGGMRLGLLTTLCLLPMGLFGLWEESMQTLALMLTAVFFALALGIPIGIWAARNTRVETFLRPILDGMQTMPAFVYLIPVLLFFGIARVPSVIATLVYALPPIIRLTTIGIQRVSPELLEAAESFGTTDKQLLRKVQLPLALPSIMVGINQTIMMALSIVVIAALIGAGGLGDVVIKALRRLAVGNALEAGLAIVFMAVLLDRITAAMAQIEHRSVSRFQTFRLFGEGWRGNTAVERIEKGIERLYAGSGDFLKRVDSHTWLKIDRNGRLLSQQRHILTIILLLLLLSGTLRLMGVHEFPEWLRIDISSPIDNLVQWMQVNLFDIGGSGIGTGPLRDFLIIYVFRPLKLFLTEIVPWAVMAFLFTALALYAGGARLGIMVFLMTVAIGLLGMWSFAMDTLSQTMVAVVICVAYGVPLGIWAAHNERVEQFLRPILDFLQTIPIFVYLVPTIMLFRSGSVPALIAAVLYSAVPVIRLTSAGIRAVDKTVVESAICFGSTQQQILRKVEIPLAFPSIMLGINQTIMMVLAMVIIAGLIGATGLGFEVYQGFTNDNLGQSVEAGLAIVLLAIIIDRITQQLAQKAANSANLQS